MYHLQRKRIHLYSQNLVISSGSDRVWLRSCHFLCVTKHWLPLLHVSFFCSNNSENKKLALIARPVEQDVRAIPHLKRQKVQRKIAGHGSLEDRWMVKGWQMGKHESRVSGRVNFTGRSDDVDNSATRLWSSEKLSHPLVPVWYPVPAASEEKGSLLSVLFQNQTCELKLCYR